MYPRWNLDQKALTPGVFVFCKNLSYDPPTGFSTVYIYGIYECCSKCFQKNPIWNLRLARLFSFVHDDELWNAGLDEEEYVEKNRRYYWDEWNLKLKS